MNIPTTRAEAKRTGAKYYFTGKPCKHGHIALRKTKGTCIECLRDEWQKSNDKRKEISKSEASKAAGRRYYERNIELVKLRVKSQPKEKRKQYRKRWKDKNKDRVRLDTNTRRRRLRKATPPWVTNEQRQQMREVYKQAAELTKQTGIKYAVDHIIPLQGENVCGLHVPWNLQTLRHSANVKKGNKLDL